MVGMGGFREVRGGYWGVGRSGIEWWYMGVLGHWRCWDRRAVGGLVKIWTR